MDTISPSERNIQLFLMHNSRCCSLPQHPINMMIPTQVKPIDSAQNITIHLIGAYNSTITMSSFDSVNDIANVVNAQDSFYISNGRILSPAFSLSFQGIKDGDTIHVLKKKTKPEKMYVVRENYQLENDVISKLRERFDKGWAHKFKDPDAVFEQLRDASNPTTAGESSRLSDLFKTRIETNPAAYKKVCMRYRKELEGDPKIQSSLPTVLPLKSNHHLSKCSQRIGRNRHWRIHLKKPPHGDCMIKYKNIPYCFFWH